MDELNNTLNEFVDLSARLSKINTNNLPLSLKTKTLVVYSDLITAIKRFNHEASELLTVMYMFENLGEKNEQIDKD